MKIAARLWLGLGAILALVGALGVVTWVQTQQLWEQTRDLYEHPFTVRFAVGEIKADILAMHRAMKDLCLADDEAGRERALQEMERFEVDAYRQFDVVFERYLGPRSDVEAAVGAFSAWKAIREETIRILRAGRVEEAVRRTTPTGPGGGHVDTLLALVGTIADFARDRAGRFYTDAELLHRAQALQLLLLIAAILVAAVTLVALMVRGVRRPLDALAAAADAFRGGDLAARSRLAPRDEFGRLSTAFDALADTVQRDIQLRDHGSRLAAGMLKSLEARAFDRQVLEPLVRLTGSQVGALYVLDERRGSYEHVESIGLGPAGRVPVDAAAREGEIGAALAARRIVRITDIPPDTRFTFSAVTGALVPREIVTIPLVSGPEVPAVISLASVRPFPPQAIRLLEDQQDALAVWVTTMLAHLRVQDLTESLERQNRELEAQKKELAAQADELGEQNIELEMQKRELEEASRLKSVFLSTVSHELRTPLNAVIALSGVLARRLAGSAPAEELGYLSVIERNGRNLLALINDLLDLARIESGREEIVVEEFAPAELVAEVAATVGPAAREKGLALTVATEEAPPLLRGDRHKCRHILLNLAGNAVKFTERGGVTLSARREGERLRVTVRDTGIGIAADALPRIFEEFRQGDAGTARRFGGTGLGLAIAKRYATLLGGGISVESAPGQGSTFTLELPLAIGAGQPARSGEAPRRRPIPPGTAAPVGASGARRRILLVEDNEAAIVQMTDILRERDYGIVVARNGREALAAVAAEVPDAVILDLMMPEVDGFQVLAAIRGTPATARLPVLVLTAKEVTPDELATLEGNHVHQLIQKGDISRTELLAAVDDMAVSRTVEVSPPARVRIPAAGPGRPLILVVEDNPDNRITLRAVLEGIGTIAEACDGREGVDAARRLRPDLILMDLSLPVLDGFAALAAIRGDPATRDIPVLAVTASAMKGSREDVLAHGFDGYVSKPVDVEEMRRAVREALHGA